MQTSTSNSSINYKTSKATTSNKNSINASVDTSSTQTLNTSSTRNVETETVDLSSETNESKGIFETIGDGIAAAGATIGEAASDFINNVETIIGKADDLISSNPITKAITDIYSTKAVIGTSVLSGLLKIAENVEDGKKWAEGKMIEAGAYVAGQVVGLFSEEAKESIDSWRKDFSTSIKEDIAIDKVGEANKWFYEETELGRRINAHSAIKYDSEAAKKIQGISKTAGEIAAATGLTIITGELPHHLL